MDRLRQYRVTEEIRKEKQDVKLQINNFIHPVFVQENGVDVSPVVSLPGINRYSLKGLPQEIHRIQEAGINKVLLFGIPSVKDERGSAAWADDSIVCRAVRMLKETAPRLSVITDVCLCAYTDHGHCGIISGSDVDNDATLPLLVKTAVSHVKAGADIVAPSAMMDGQVGAIRAGLDENKISAKILAYSVKYASSLYGPFRDAAGSSPSFGDRKTYQMDFRNTDQIYGEVEADLKEKADMLMVKPALFYLDSIYRIKSQYKEIPLAAYQVSGEYAMIRKCDNWKNIYLESLYAIKRAGADFIITYGISEVREFIYE